jgi:hypothetical protein
VLMALSPAGSTIDHESANLFTSGLAIDEFIAK